MSNSSSSTATKPSSYYNVGDNTVASAVWDGNKYITTYNPTSNQTTAMNYLDSALAQAYADATDSDGIASYKQNWIDNQTAQLNETAK